MVFVWAGGGQGNTRESNLHQSTISSRKKSMGANKLLLRGIVDIVVVVVALEARRSHSTRDFVGTWGAPCVSERDNNRERRKHELTGR